MSANWIVGMGDAFYGFKTYGPFEDDNKAEAFADAQREDCKWVRLQKTTTGIDDAGKIIALVGHLRDGFKPYGPFLHITDADTALRKDDLVPYPVDRKIFYLEDPD